MTVKPQKERYIDAYKGKSRKLLRPLKTGRIADDSGVLYGHLLGLLLVKQEEKEGK